MKKLGLIVNPVAGMGGAVGLKGTDGADTLERARELGAVPHAQERTTTALTNLTGIADDIELLTYGSTMGEAVAAACGLRATLVGSPSHPDTTAQDTVAAARAMHAAGVELLLFAGGDGTARDICGAVGTDVVALGIPAGVKIHSAVFAANPTAAGQVAAAVIAGNINRAVEAEVMDIDEEDYRREVLSARLYGYLRIPDARRLLQGLKAGSPRSDAAMQMAIASELVERMADDRYYIVGPGTTCRPFMERLGLDHTLLGVDVIRAGRQIGKDVSEQEILSIVDDSPCTLVVTPVGGQGFLLGRGNQQISPDVIRQVSKENISVVATAEKLCSLRGKPLLVDTGDEDTDTYLSGYYRVITGYHENTIYRVSPPT
ncbi:MAG: ATP-NAD kinase family protein [Gemmatimonadota bacterium]|nr:MAG: ATP-NAD kinase family protein [Gemmatimonadota bacterium]